MSLSGRNVDRSKPQTELPTEDLVSVEKKKLKKILEKGIKDDEDRLYIDCYRCHLLFQQARFDPNKDLNKMYEVWNSIEEKLISKHGYTKESVRPIGRVAFLKAQKAQDNGDLEEEVEKIEIVLGIRQKENKQEGGVRSARSNCN